MANIWNSRTLLLLGEERLEKIEHSHVLIVGLGGVGAAAAECICRAGVGKITIVDTDVVEESNRNRQLGALVSTNGMAKAEVWKNRLLDINPDAEVQAITAFLSQESIPELLKSEKFDYVMDCIDTLAPKVELIAQCYRMQIPVVSAMGAGGKKNPSLVKMSDIAHSYNCRLAKYVRKRLHNQGIYKGIKVVFSPENIDKERLREVDGKNKKTIIGTISYLPPIFGSFAASMVVRELAGIKVRLWKNPYRVIRGLE